MSLGAWLQLVLQGIRARPGRAVLSVIILTASALAFLAAEVSSSAVRQIIGFQEERTAGRVATVAGHFDARELGGRRMSDVADTLRRRVGTGNVSAVQVESTRAVDLPTGATAVFSVIVTAGDLRGVRRIELRDGRWLRRRGERGVVVNYAAWHRSGEARYLRLHVSGCRRGRTVPVVGVADDGLSQPTVYLTGDSPAARTTQIAFNDSLVGTVLVHGRPDAVASNARAAADTLAVHRLNDRPTIARIDAGPATEGTLRAVHRVAVAVAVISVIVAILGVLSIGLASIRERVDELAVRRALGLSKIGSAALVLGEVVVVAAVAAVVTLAVGFLGYVSLTDQADAFPLGAAVRAIMISTAASLVGAALPAIRAARIAIAQTMRA